MKKILNNSALCCLMAFMALWGRAESWVDENQNVWGYSVSGGSATITGTSQQSGVLRVPSAVSGIPVVSIAGNAFEGHRWLSGAVIPEGVTNVGYVFAGWYRDAEGWEPVEGETDYRSPSYTYVVGEDDATFYAKFISVEDDWIEVETSVCSEFVPGVPIAREAIGVYVMSESLPTVKVTGLPTGLKFDAKTLAISGAPTKSGVYTVTVSATTAGKWTSTKQFRIIVRGAKGYAVSAKGV